MKVEQAKQLRDAAEDFLCNHNLTEVELEDDGHPGRQHNAFTDQGRGAVGQGNGPAEGRLSSKEAVGLLICHLSVQSTT